MCSLCTQVPSFHKFALDWRRQVVLMILYFADCYVHLACMQWLSFPYRSSCSLTYDLFSQILFLPYKLILGIALLQHVTVQLCFESLVFTAVFGCFFVANIMTWHTFMIIHKLIIEHQYFFYGLMIFIKCNIILADVNKIL